MTSDPRAPAPAAARFRRAYAELRRREGRGDAVQLLSLPYVTDGSWADQWRVRARTFDRFIAAVIEPRERTRSRPLRVLDLGSGNGWLCYRLQLRGHAPVAVDWRYDDVDGLGAARGYAPRLESLFRRAAASFDSLPFTDGSFDMAVFNASIHYATDLRATLAEAVRVLGPTGSVAILDSPFYRSARDGEAMVAEKRSGGGLDLGPAMGDLLALPFIEYLTRDGLVDASAELGLSWTRHRVRYPMAYELRPLWAALRGRRMPSRFDLWEGRRIHR